MKSHAQKTSLSSLYGVVEKFCWSPWLKLVGAVLAFALICIYAASVSELGDQISLGESPAFAWLRQHMLALLILGLAYFAVTWFLHIRCLLIGSNGYPRSIMLLTGAEVVALGTVLFAVSNESSAMLAWGHVLLQSSLLTQTILGVSGSYGQESRATREILLRRKKFPLQFLCLFFLLSAAPAFLDPSWQRLREYVLVDSTLEYVLCRLVPPLLSGFVAICFALTILLVLALQRILAQKLNNQVNVQGFVSLFPFLSVAGLFTAVSIALLVRAAHWQVTKLGLLAAVFPLFVVLTGGAGALSYAGFVRLAPYLSEKQDLGPVEVVSFSFGAALVFPVTWLFTSSSSGRWSYRMVLASTLVGSILMGIYVLYGDLFNPWFTSLSYVKSAFLKVTALVAAGSLCVVSGRFISTHTRRSSNCKRIFSLGVVICVVGFLPVVVFNQYPETKAAVLQFNEISRVDAAYARGLAGALGMSESIHLGQNPKASSQPVVWPQPWTLKKTAASMLPKDFNLLMIVADALRGDAFHSAGYHRNLTPFLDRWAMGETVSFARAYSQGGGSFASFPFLVGGRSRFSLYGPEMYRENLYFKLAMAEGIQEVMVVKDFGPRAIFPPDFPVRELGDGMGRTDHRSPPADEVFGWAKDAIDELAPGQRFFCFLHLMDVHNDLWKKRDGVDFGDGPRDLYDNNLSYLDRAFQRFVTWLKGKGVYQRTVILFTSDHGEQFWEHGASLHGHTLYEEEIRVPLILLAHGIQARVDDVPVVTADMAPTLVELAGYSVQPPYDDPHMGISLVPLLKGSQRERYLHRDIVGRASFKRRYFLYRDWEWKLIYFAELDLLQLFNTIEDPGETKNLLQERPAQAAELERELLEYLERVEGKRYRPLLSHSLTENSSKH